jgi:hypothetical protein
MKKLSLILSIAILGFAGFKMISEKDSAKVEQKEGVLIFMFSKPTSEYTYIGSVKKTGIVMSGKPEEMFNTLLRRCKKDFPQADGLIFTSVDMEKADCIKIKE